MPDANQGVLPHFPFSAIEGQEELQLALLLAAVDPRLGGVLVEGPRGTAKTTAARGLADLLAPAPFVTLPLGCSLEHLVGSLDIGQALSRQQLAFAPGLLAKAHGGVLYVDEINLLPDALVDVLLDVAASGVNRVERDGISHQHAASFVLVGTMNAQEGRLRPQLLDRLGLCVAVANVGDAALRQRIVRARLAFDRDPVGFAHAHEARQRALAQRLRAARALLDAVSEQTPDAVLAGVAGRCIAADVDGMRADIVMLRAAQACAAWEAATDPAREPMLAPAHVAQVAELVLRHRRGAGGADAAASKPAPGEPASSPTPSPAPTPQRPEPPAPQAPTPAASRDAESAAEQTDWGGMAAEAAPPAAAGNPLLQQWLTTLSDVLARDGQGDPAKKA
jgi:magnesium chelatase subunit I